MAKTVRERLMQAIKVNESTGCWEWENGRSTSGGYGVLSINNKQEKAHRAMWRSEFGEIPEGMCVLHKCDNPPCCNPDHLFLGTVADNNKDRDSKGRQAKGRSVTRNRRSFRGEQDYGVFRRNDRRAYALPV